MDIEELESRLQGGTETQNFDIKAAGSWDVQSLVKDILAMANVEDGGLILIGVADETFERQGLSEAQIATFKIDVMRDQVASYADPYVDFSVSFPTDASKTKIFAAIRVEPFVEVPVICRRNGTDVREATLYYRNRNKRWQSAAISNAHDLAEVLDRAVDLRMRKLQKRGLIPQAAAKSLQPAVFEASEILKKELGDL